MVISPQHDAGFHSWRYANIAKNNSAYVLSEWPDILLLTQSVILVTLDIYSISLDISFISPLPLYEAKLP